MLDIEHLKKIHELDAKALDELGDKVGELAETANAFIEALPAKEVKIKEALRVGENAALGKNLAALGDFLEQLCAAQLAETCSDLLRSADEAGREELESRVVEFLKSVLALSIDLQMIVFKEKPAAAPEPPPDVPPKAIEPNTILAVDDVAFFLSSIKNMLQNTPYKATCVLSGQAALNYLRNHAPALFILDIEMPDMDGYRLAEAIRAAGHVAPILFLTGNAQKDAVVRAMQAGATDIILKPINQNRLLERIDKHLAPKKKKKEAAPE